MFNYKKYRFFDGTAYEGNDKQPIEAGRNTFYKRKKLE